MKCPDENLFDVSEESIFHGGHSFGSGGGDGGFLSEGGHSFEGGEHSFEEGGGGIFSEEGISFEEQSFQEGGSLGDGFGSMVNEYRRDADESEEDVSRGAFKRVIFTDKTDNLALLKQSTYSELSPDIQRFVGTEENYKKIIHNNIIYSTFFSECVLEHIIPNFPIAVFDGVCDTWHWTLTERASVALKEFIKYNDDFESDKDKIMFQCLVAFMYMHRLGVSHNDVKSDNILIKEFEHPQRFCYNINGKQYSFETKYLALVYDFDFTSKIIEHDDSAEFKLCFDRFNFYHNDMQRTDIVFRDTAHIDTVSLLKCFGEDIMHTDEELLETYGEQFLGRCDKAYTMESKAIDMVDIDAELQTIYDTTVDEHILDILLTPDVCERYKQLEDITQHMTGQNKLKYTEILQKIKKMCGML